MFSCFALPARKAGRWHGGRSGGPRPRPAPDPAFPALSLGPASARRRPCKAPVGPLALNAFTVSRSGLVVSSRSLVAVPADGGQGPPGPAQPGGSRSAAPGSIPAPAVPSALPAGPGLEPPLAPARGSCRPPHKVRRGRCPDVPSAVRPVPCRFPSYGCRRSEPPRHQQLFLNFFDEFFPLRRAWHFRRSPA
jgi:hypothetical protein